MQSKEEQRKKQIKKYTVKPPKDLKSKFEQKMEARRIAEEKAEADKRRAEEEAKAAVSISLTILHNKASFIFL